MPDNTAGAKDKASAAAGDVDLCYRWQEGQQYFYRISFKAEINDSLMETTGANTYTIGRAANTNPAARSSGGSPGSGTAFVVSSDGYLLTCDHVVRGATDIKVRLGEQTSPCEVIARDSAHDLALIRIARQGLPVIPLADSEAVEIAEEVRAVGYPLSDVLGSTIKVTQGSVAGVVAKRRGKVFQIDAVVNPGNSGGPLVDGRGAVVGVVNAQLVGMQISKVGFAVPVNYAKTMLTRHRVKFQAASGAKLDGPALAKRVSPSVGFVTMTCHGDDSPGEDRRTLSYHGFLDHRQQTKAAAEAAMASPQVDSSERDDGKLIVDEYGEVNQFTGHVNLPCLLGPLGSVAIDPLPADGEKTWQRQELLTIHPTRQGPYDPLASLRPRDQRGPFFHPPPGFPFGGPFGDVESARAHYPAIQQISYTADDPKGTTLLIRKHLELKTLDRTEAGPKVELTGNGETLFDLRAGVPQKLTFSGTLVVRESHQTTNIPLTLRCERSTASNLPTSATPDVAATTPAPSVKKTPLAGPQVSGSMSVSLDGYLADLGAVDKDWNKCFRALQALSMMKPIETRRDEVSQVLDKYLTEASYSARSSALNALRGWGSKRNVPALIRLLEPSENEALRRPAIELLGTLGDARAAAAIAQRVKDAADRPSAVQALRALGRGAEEATIALLGDQDVEVRDEACRVLADIGGPKSIAALKALTLKTGAGSLDTPKATLEKLERSQKK